MSNIENLEPKLLWKHFDEIRKIPHCSKNEDKIREYIVNFAKNNSLKYKIDKSGNIVIFKPADKIGNSSESQAENNPLISLYLVMNQKAVFGHQGKSRNPSVTSGNQGENCRNSYSIHPLRKTAITSSAL